VRAQSRAASLRDLLDLSFTVKAQRKHTSHLFDWSSAAAITHFKSSFFLARPHTYDLLKWWPAKIPQKDGRSQLTRPGDRAASLLDLLGRAAVEPS